MAYITIDDLKTRDGEQALVNLTDPDGQEVVQAVIDRVIASAQAEIDSYIAGRVRLPLAAGEVSQQIKHNAILIARFYLYADRKTEAIKAEYEQAVRWLRDVAAGRASCGVAQEPLTGDTTKAIGSTVFVPSATRVFGSEFERRYDVPIGPNGSGEFGRGLA